MSDASAKAVIEYLKEECTRHGDNCVEVVSVWMENEQGKAVQARPRLESTTQLQTLIVETMTVLSI